MPNNTIDDVVRNGVEYMNQLEKIVPGALAYLIKVQRGVNEGMPFSGRVFFKIDFTKLSSAPNTTLRGNDNDYACKDIEDMIKSLIRDKEQSTKNPDYKHMFSMIFAQVQQSSYWHELQARINSDQAINDNEKKELLNYFLTSYCYRIVAASLNNVMNTLNNPSMATRQYLMQISTAAKMLKPEDVSSLAVTAQQKPAAEAKVSSVGATQKPAAKDGIDYETIKTSLKTMLDPCLKHYTKGDTEKSKFIRQQLEAIINDIPKINNPAELTKICSALKSLNDEVNKRYPMFIILRLFRAKTTLESTVNNIDKSLKAANLASVSLTPPKEQARISPPSNPGKSG